MATWGKTHCLWNRMSCIPFSGVPSSTPRSIQTAMPASVCSVKHKRIELALASRARTRMQSVSWLWQNHEPKCFASDQKMLPYGTISIPAWVQKMCFKKIIPIWHSLLRHAFKKALDANLFQRSTPVPDRTTCEPEISVYKWKLPM